jgi:hypothetical protein
MAEAGVHVARRFHGMDPSRNKKDRKFRKVAEEQERKRRAMSGAAADDSSLSRIQAVQQATAAPYLVRAPALLAACWTPRCIMPYGWITCILACNSFMSRGHHVQCYTASVLTTALLYE